MSVHGPYAIRTKEWGNKQHGQQTMHSCERWLILDGLFDLCKLTPQTGGLKSPFLITYMT